ncbi:MAG TPA: M2 family metallopeptidase [Terriglobales bacterium]|nr:M2 family metallopeptidase [Terriglobales bacterium]
MSFKPAFLLLVITLFAGTVVAQQTPPSPPTVAEAQRWMQRAEAELLDVNTKQSRADWVQETYITDDTEVLSAEANDLLIGTQTRLIEESKRFNGLQLPPELARKMLILKLSLTLPAPSNAAERSQLTRIAAALDGGYGRAKYCPKSGPYAGQCLGQSDMEAAFATQRDPAVLRDLWIGWHNLGAQLKPNYEQLVALSNKGARELGFHDTGALWRSGYDMPPDQFTAETHRLWEEVRPLYESLHAYVRMRLSQKYGPQVVPPDGMIPADLLGNVWGQEWGNIYDLVAPPGLDKPAVDLTDLLKNKNVQPLDMVHYGENFYKSLGFAPLPKTFWERSLFVKPADRDVICHASAWDVDSVDDLRLKMCIKVMGEDFITIHHELGHNFYQRAYNRQPFLFRNGANDGFHEAIGDTIALNITPEYLVKIGLLNAAPPRSEASDIGLLLKQGLDKIAFLPFGLMIDEWRWRVFSGEVQPADYNQAWWELREKYEGVAPPVARPADAFDPGAKYHIPANFPYMRYFLARILQFQFYRGMCRAAGYTGPLYQCSVYGNKAAGEKLAKMLEMGQSRPWPEALKVLTGEDRMDASAMMEYFAPLKKWLDEQTKGQKIGWTVPGR